MKTLRQKVREMDDVIKKLQSDNFDMKDEIEKLLTPPKFKLMDKVKFEDRECTIIGTEWDYKHTQIFVYEKGWLYKVIFDDGETTKVKEDKLRLV